MKQTLIPALLLIGLTSAFAQEEQAAARVNPVEKMQEDLTTVEGKLTGLEESYLETKGIADKLNKFSISGYTQFQYRTNLDTVANANYNIGEFQGGSLPVSKAGTTISEGFENQFQIRRGRLKVSYKGDKSSSSAEFEILPKGVSLKDLQFNFQIPGVPFVGARAGVFDRPFGFEVGHSSSAMEVIERSRGTQILFPGEKDMGASLNWTPGDSDPEWMHMISLNAGLFTGEGGTADESDDGKDFIGRAGFKVPMADLGLQLDGGVSYYQGTVHSINDSVMNFKSGAWTLTKDYNAKAERSYVGADVQFYYDVPVIGGMTLRSEWVSGTQPSTKSSMKLALANEKLYVREFQSYYLWLVQNLGSKVQLSARYDMFDPNTEVEETDFAGTAATTLTTADVAYSTIAYGASYALNANTRIGVYYDQITNEKVANPNISKVMQSDLTDDVLSVRLQYKF